MKIKFYFLIIGLSLVAVVGLSPAIAQTAINKGANTSTDAVAPAPVVINPELDKKLKGLHREILPPKNKTLESLSYEEPKQSFASSKTDNLTVAILFYRITGQTPDFESWALRTFNYKGNNELEKEAKFNETQAALKSKYSLTSFNEAINVESYVTLKQYSAKGAGFFVQQFNEETFFPYDFNGETYAVIPTDLMDNQWLEMTAEKAAQLKKHMNKKGQLFMRLILTPIQGQRDTKVPLSNGKDNWLLASKVQDIEIWSPKTKELLWRKNADAFKQRNKLLNLYR